MMVAENEVEFRLPYPPSANAYWRSAPRRGLVPSKEAMKYKADVVTLTSGAGSTPLVGRVAVTLRVFRPRASGDLDNTLKVLFDALKFIAWLDDKQVAEIHAHRDEDPDKKGYVLVTATGERRASLAEVAAAREAAKASSQKRRETLKMSRLLQSLGR